MNSGDIFLELPEHQVTQLSGNNPSFKFQYRIKPKENEVKMPSVMKYWHCLL